jgi:hypothetical protein
VFQKLIGGTHAKQLKSPAQTPGFRPPNQKTSGKRKMSATGPAKLISP